jgi:hypothetical protein
MLRSIGVKLYARWKILFSRKNVQSDCHGDDDSLKPLFRLRDDDTETKISYYYFFENYRR